MNPASFKARSAAVPPITPGGRAVAAAGWGGWVQVRRWMHGCCIQFHLALLGGHVAQPSTRPTERTLHFTDNAKPAPASGGWRPHPWCRRTRRPGGWRQCATLSAQRPHPRQSLPACQQPGWRFSGGRAPHPRAGPPSGAGGLRRRQQRRRTAHASTTCIRPAGPALSHHPTRCAPAVYVSHRVLPHRQPRAPHQLLHVRPPLQVVF